jgi:hypothetical protein
MAKGRKTGGRKKGTPNKKTQVAAEILEELGFCPIRKGVEMFERALEEFEEDRSDYRFKYLEIAHAEIKDLRQYVFPKRKAIDLTSKGEALTFADFIAALEGRAEGDKGGS